MKINSASIGMESARRYNTSNKTIRRFMVKDDQKTQNYNGALLGTLVQGEEKEETKKKDEKNVTATTAWQNQFSVKASRVNIRSKDERALEDIRQETIRYIFDLLFASYKRRFRQPSEEYAELNKQPENQNQTEQLNSGALLFQSIRVQNSIGVQESLHYESEQVQFSTMGTVRTADGREINFNVNVGMSREVAEYSRQELKRADYQMCDPLVINLDTDIPALSDQTIYFDLDGDGQKENIASLSQGSGYLAVDWNEDGVINDGKELFGTRNGDGFKDLARFDEDGNGWIDENDAIWSKLKIWCKDEDGKDVLYKLSDKGVGAICLQKVATNFMLNNEAGNTLGAIRSTGVFLYENGMAGTMSHVDVAKRIYQLKA